MKRSAWFTSGAIVLLAAAMTAQQPPQAEKLLLLTDVTEVVTSLKALKTGLKTVEKNPATGASGDLNITDGTGELLLTLTVARASEFDLWKRNAAGKVSDVGTEAYEYPNKQTAGGMPPYMLIFRKGAYAVMLVSMFNSQGAPRIPQAELKLLGQRIAARL